MSIGRLRLEGYGELRPTIPLVILGVALVLVVLAVVLIARSQRPRGGSRATKTKTDTGGSDGPLGG